MSHRSQMIPKNFSTILHSQFNYHTLPITPFKAQFFSTVIPINRGANYFVFVKCNQHKKYTGCHNKHNN